MKSMIVEKWDSVLNHEDVPAITGETRQTNVAAILENQHKDIENNIEGSYTDHNLVAMMKGLSPLSEAVVDGDHGYDPQKIAAGETSGAVTNVGPTVMGLVRRAIPNMLALDNGGGR